MRSQKVLLCMITAESPQGNFWLINSIKTWFFISVVQMWIYNHLNSTLWVSTTVLYYPQMLFPHYSSHRVFMNKAACIWASKEISLSLLKHCDDCISILTFSGKYLCIRYFLSVTSHFIFLLEFSLAMAQF